jgi:hypothetical protein
MPKPKSQDLGLVVDAGTGLASRVLFLFIRSFAFLLPFHVGFLLQALDDWLYILC